MITVFFDMDGCLCDFVRGALKLHNREDVDVATVPWGMEAHLGITPAEFWSPLGFGFWANLGKLEDGFGLLAVAEQLVGARNIGLLTSPCDTSGCYDGKKAWVKKHLPEYTKRLFTGSAKELMGAPTKILVDDHDPNVERFREGDGKAVLVPRPWNSGRALVNPDGSFDVLEVARTLEGSIHQARLEL